MNKIGREIKRVVVTGATGVTGNALLRHLLDRGIRVTCLVRENSKRASSLPGESGLLNIMKCNLEDYKYLTDKDFDQVGYDCFFHLAWEGSKGTEKVRNRYNYKMQNENVGYALDAVDLCRKISCKMFIMTGSQAEYGDTDGLICEDNEKNPKNAYGMAKLCAEGMTRLMCREYGIEHIWPILFSIYGPKDGTESMIDVSVKKALKEEYIDYTEGKKIWNYLYSYDAAKALYLLAKYGKSGETYNVASAENKSLSAYIEDMYEIIAPGKIPKLGKKKEKNTDISGMMPDIKKLTECTGFTEEYTFKEGIKRIQYEHLQRL